MDLKQFMLALSARRKAFFVAFLATVVTAIAVALMTMAAGHVAYRQRSFALGVAQ